MDTIEERIELAVVSILTGALFSLFFMKKCLVPEDVNLFLLHEQISYEELNLEDLKSESID